MKRIYRRREPQRDRVCYCLIIDRATFEMPVHGIEVPHNLNEQLARCTAHRGTASASAR